jgi:outer membrane receptor protein involved in Fe transport
LTLGPASQLRLAGSHTVNRPDFRELSNAYRDLPVGGGKLIGNPNLKKADIWSADLRWEHFPPEPEKLVQRQSLSLGVFYKHFLNAIEETNLPAATGGVIVTYDNVPRAFNTGAELEWVLHLTGLGNRLYLRANRRDSAFLRGLSGVVRDLSSSGNLALIYSQIDYAGSGKGVNTTEVRPLQGQSPYVVNISLGYENSVPWHDFHPVHLNLFLNYNIAGRRISRIGTYGAPDYYEEAFHQLDLVVKQRFSRHFSLSFKARNLLDLPARETVGEVLLREYRKGRSFTLGGTIEF